MPLPGCVYLKSLETRPPPLEQELSERPHVVVATPGRLADHLRSCDTFSLAKIRYLVVDEADRMFDGSFDEHLQGRIDRWSRWIAGRSFPSISLVAGSTTKIISTVR